MYDPDDERFEQYLKGFRPLEPRPFAAERASRGASVALWIGAAALLLVTVALVWILEINEPQEPRIVGGVESSERITETQPLTMQSATELLAAEPSWKDALNGLAFQSRGVALPKGSHSALAVLSKEKIEP